MNDQQYDAIMRELDSLKPDDNLQYNGIGLGGIRSRQVFEDSQVEFDDPDDITHQLRRRIEFDNEFDGLDRQHDEIQRAIQFEDQKPFDPLVIKRKIEFDYEYPEDRYPAGAINFADRSKFEPDESSASGLAKFRRDYGSISDLQRDTFQPDDPNDQLHVDKALIGKIEFEDPRMGTTSILYDNGMAGRDGNIDGDDELNANGISRVEVTNFVADLILPVTHMLETLTEAQFMSDRDNTRSIVSMLGNILRSNIENHEKTNSSFLNGLKFQYDLFMRHPLWNTMVGIQRYLISPAFKLVGGLLFGFNKKASVEEKILKAIEQQTEFMSTGEIGGRGLMERIMNRGILGTVASAAAYPILNSLGISKAEAQRREDSRARGENVESNLLGWLTDRYGRGDITQRGRGGRGEIEEGRYESSVEKVTEWFRNKLKKETTSTALATIDEVNRVQYDNPADEMELSNLNIMQIGMVDKLLIDNADLSFSEKIMRDFSQSFVDAITVVANAATGDVRSIRELTPEFDINSANPIDELNSNISSMFRNMSSVTADRPTGNVVADSIATGNDDNGSRLSNIITETGMLVEQPEMIVAVRKGMEVDKIVNRKQEDIWTEESVHRNRDVSIMDDVRKFTKETAKETEKVRKQGTWRMLLGLGSSLIAGISAVTSSVLSIGGAIVAAIAGGSLISKATDLFGGRNKRRGPAAPPPRVPPGRTPGATPRAPGPNIGTVGKVGGVLGAGLAAYEGYDIWTDEESSTGQKLRDTTSLGGSVVGGLAGAKAGAVAGAALGSIVPFFGTAVGGIVGGLAGGIGGSMLGGSAGDSLGSIFTLGDDDTPVMKVPTDGSIMENLRNSEVSTKSEEEAIAAEKANPEKSIVQQVKDKASEVGNGLIGASKSVVDGVKSGDTPIVNTGTTSVVQPMTDPTDSKGIMSSIFGYNSDDLAAKGVETTSAISGLIPDSVTNGIESISSRYRESTTEVSSRLDVFGSQVSSSIKKLSDDMRFTIGSMVDKGGDSITAIQNSKAGIELQSVISENTFSMAEANEVGNKILKTIEKTLGDMLNLQKTQASAEPTDDNSTLIDSMKNFMTRS